jgi:hypothetical protein
MHTKKGHRVHKTQNNINAFQCVLLTRHISEVIMYISVMFMLNRITIFSISTLVYAVPDGAQTVVNTAFHQHKGYSMF